MRDQEPISQWQLTGSSGGIEIESLSPEYVNEYEIRQAAIFSLTSRKEWLELDLDERAMIVAHYRLSKLIELHYAERMNEEVKQSRLP